MATDPGDILTNLPPELTPEEEEILKRLEEAISAEKRALILEFIEAHPEGRLALPKGANLQGADLSVTYLQEANLQGANLQGANLKYANLQEAYLENSTLKGANLGFATLQGANFRHANLQGSDLSFTKLQGADLGLANLQGANLVGATLQGANLEFAKLQGADLRSADLQEADLSFAYLQETDLGFAKLQGADLREAHLQQLDLSNCLIKHVHLSGAWLDRTRLRLELLGGAIGEEVAGDYERAKNGYLLLKQNFDEWGDYEASNWAYRKERRMEKLEAGSKARAAFTKRQWREFVSNGSKYLGDEVIEIVSDYGEGFWRVFWWIVALILIIGPVLFWFFGAFEWSEAATETYFSYSYRWQQLGEIYVQLLLYTIDTFTTANFAELKPTNNFTRLASGLLAMLGIFMVGLLGFVAGNRIRRS